MIAAGTLTERVMVFAPVRVRGDFGEQQVRYEHRGTVWASVKFQRGAEALTGGDVWLQRTVVVTLRDSRVLDERCRLRWDGKLYKIESLNRVKVDGTATVVATAIDEGNEGGLAATLVEAPLDAEDDDGQESPPERLGTADGKGYYVVR